MTLSTNIKLD